MLRHFDFWLHDDLPKVNRPTDNEPTAKALNTSADENVEKRPYCQSWRAKFFREYFEKQIQHPDIP